MTSVIANEAIKNRWVTYSKDEGLRVCFGLKDFIITFAMIVVAPNIPAMLQIIEQVTR